MSTERTAIKQISEIQRKSVAGYWPGWKLTDYTNRKTLHPHLSPEYFTMACFYFPTPQWHLHGNRDPPLFNVKVFMVYHNRLEGSCLAGALQIWWQPKVKLLSALYSTECAYFRAGQCTRPWLYTLCDTDMVSVLVECIAYWGKRDLILTCTIYIYTYNMLM